MRKALMITATVAMVGAGVMAKGHRVAARQPHRARLATADALPLPYDAYPDDLELEIWNGHRW